MIEAWLGTDPRLLSLAGLAALNALAILLWVVPRIPRLVVAFPRRARGRVAADRPGGAPAAVSEPAVEARPRGEAALALDLERWRRGLERDGANDPTPAAAEPRRRSA